MNAIDKIDFHGMVVSVYGTKDDPLFLAVEIAKVIDYSVGKTGQMLETVDPDEKVFLNTHYIVSGNPNSRRKGNPGKWFLTENGLYEVLMQSRKPVAKQFKSVVKRMLKDLRIQGGYSMSEWFGKFANIEELDGFNDLREDFGLPPVSEEQVFGRKQERWYERGDDICIEIESDYEEF